MKLKTVVVTIALAAFAFFATAAAQQTGSNSQSAVPQSMPGMMAGPGMGHGMMNIIDQVKNDLASLANENDPVVLHKRIAQDQALLDQFRMPMRGNMQGMRGSMMSGRGMMSGSMPNCPRMAQPQPQK
jgi:hypothetical protein